MIKKVLLTLMFSFVFLTPIQAIGKNTTSGPENVKLREEIQTKKCELRESRINFRMNLYNENRDNRYQIYQGITKRLNSLVATYKNRGCDVTGLEANLVKFDALIEEFSAAFRDFTNSMNQAKLNRCREDDSAYKSDTQGARAKLTLVRQKSQAVHAYFKSTLKPSLSQKIKTCRPSPKPSPTVIPTERID